jgi:hypothetical protein
LDHLFFQQSVACHYLHLPHNISADLSKEAIMTQAAAGFPLFTSLPAEIQGQIWDYHYETQPRFRHCFDYRGDTRVYFAFEEGLARNMAQTETLDKTPSGGVPVRVLDEKVRLVGKNHLLVRKNRSVRNVWNVRGQQRASTSVSAWVDFKRDIFYFHQGGVSLGWQWFRVLSNPIDREPPAALPNEHWIFQVQHLAIHIRNLRALERAIQEASPHHPIIQRTDRRILSHMKNLRKFSIVVGTSGRAYIDAASEQDQSEDGKLKKLTGLVPLETITLPELRLPEYCGYQLRQELLKIFREIGQNVEVKVVVDLY